jgi:hypothetical protein
MNHFRVFRRNLPVGHPEFRRFHYVVHGDVGLPHKIITKTCRASKSPAVPSTRDVSNFLVMRFLLFIS